MTQEVKKGGRYRVYLEDITDLDELIIPAGTTIQYFGIKWNNAVQAASVGFDIEDETPATIFTAPILLTNVDDEVVDYTDNLVTKLFSYVNDTTLVFKQTTSTDVTVILILETIL